MSGKCHTFGLKLIPSSEGTINASNNFRLGVLEIGATTTIKDVFCNGIKD